MAVVAETEIPSDGQQDVICSTAAAVTSSSDYSKSYVLCNVPDPSTSAANSDHVNKGDLHSLAEW